MAILVPDLGRFSSVEISYSANPWTHTPTFGAPDVRLARVGAERYSVQVTCRGMSQDDGSRIVSTVSRGLTEKLQLRLPQPGKTVPTNGTVVSGGGTTLTVSGTSPAPGQYFNITVGGVTYLHQVVAASGGALTIKSGLKVPVTSGLAVNFAAPVIEGYLIDNSLTHSFGLTGVVHLSFGIREAA